MLHDLRLIGFQIPFKKLLFAIAEAFNRSFRKANLIKTKPYTTEERPFTEPTSNNKVVSVMFGKQKNFSIINTAIFKKCI